jgi:protein-S-isoprenylcysteine O-methyltransferase Ste14
MKENRGEHPFGDAGQLIALGVFLAIWIVDSFVLHWTTFLSKDIPLVLRLILCLALLAIGLLLYRSGHRVVPHHDRPTRLVADGAFRFVRHPLYLASLLTYLGLTISTASLLALAVWVGMAVFYDYIAGYEEKLMEMKVGDEYLQYRGRTGKWIPKP